MNYITFDIETYSPSNLNKIDTKEFRVSVIGAYISWVNDGQYIAFFEDNVVDFIELLKSADLVIGYNHLWFDLPVLQKYANFDLLKLPCYDIMIDIEKRIGFKLKLDDLCKANFDNDIKTESYSTYKHYYREGKFLELTDYCMNDVRLTEQLFQKILHSKNLFYYDLHIQKQINFDKIEFGGPVDLGQVTESIF